jgi:hypothetical protein
MLDFEAAKRPGGAARFLFKKRIFHTLTAPLSSDPLALSLIYHQVWEEKMLITKNYIILFFFLFVLLCS